MLVSYFFITDAAKVNINCVMSSDLATEIKIMAWVH